MNFYRLENGRVTDIWTQFDGLGLMQQLGALPDDVHEAEVAPRSHDAAIHGDERCLARDGATSQPAPHATPSALEFPPRLVAAFSSTHSTTSTSCSAVTAGSPSSRKPPPTPSDTHACSMRHCDRSMSSSDEPTTALVQNWS